MTAASPRDFRNALGQFATGVTIVTTNDADGTPVGVTASSFNSVSLDPPLVLWSLSRTSRSMAAFQAAGGFNVHVLASHQTGLSNRFARSTDDKFEGIGCTTSANGFPVLPEYAALYQCETQYQYDGGDHVIFVGRVVDFQTNDLPVLVFHAGRYADTQHKSVEATNTADGQPGAGEFTEDFLLHLLSRAHFMGSLPNRKNCEAVELSETEYHCLSLLAMNGHLTEPDITSRLERNGHPVSPHLFHHLQSKGWVEQQQGGLAISNDGRALFIDLLAHSKALEEKLSKHFTEEEWDAAHAFLKKFIRVTQQELTRHSDD